MEGGTRLVLTSEGETDKEYRTKSVSIDAFLGINGCGQYTRSHSLDRLQASSGARGQCHYRVASELGRNNNQQAHIRRNDSTTEAGRPA